MGFFDILSAIFSKGGEAYNKFESNYERKLGNYSRETLRKCDELENSGKELTEEQKQKLSEVRGKAGKYADY